MRTVTGTMQNAIELGDCYPLVKAEIEPSRAWVDTWDHQYTWATADTSGMPDSPVPQTLGYSPVEQRSVIFYKNGSGDLCYHVYGDASSVTTSYTATHGPSLIASGGSSYVYFDQSGSIYRGTVSWSAISTRSTDPFSLASNIGTFSSIRNVVALTGAYCAVIQENDGGFKIVIVTGGGSWTSYDRFMFPMAFNYGVPRTMEQLAAWSAGIALGTQLNVYMSDPYTGSVLGITWDSSTLLFGDIFVAVPTQKTVSQCEFRCIQGYAHESVGYLVGQFRRTDNVDTEKCLTFILRSTDGRNFAMDRFPLVSDVSYPLRAAPGGDGYLYLSNSGRFGKDDLTYFFNGTATTGHLKVNVSENDIKSFSDMGLQSATLVLRSGDEVYMYEPSIHEESRCKVYVGYKTTAGTEWVLYGTYIIDKIRRGIADGKRTMELQLVNETEWKLTGLSSPFYTEFFSKSSIYSVLDEDCGDLYPAPEAKRHATSFVVDFWGAEAFSHDLITGVSLEDKGGPGGYEAGSAHSDGLGVKSKDLKEALKISEYPQITTSTLTARVWGWSHDNRVDATTGLETAGNDGTNDTIKVFLWVKHENGTEDMFASGTGNFPALWPTDHTHAGDLPIVLTIGSLTAGDRIMNVGVIASSGHETQFNVARVEIRADVDIEYNYVDANTPWEATATDGWKIPGKYRTYVMFAQKPYNAFNFKLQAEFKFTASGGADGYSLAAGLVGHGWDACNYMVGRWNAKSLKMEIGKCRDGTVEVLTTVDPPFTQGETVTLMFMHQNGRYSLWSLDSNKVWQNCTNYNWTALDGWMFDSDTATAKCGIYGLLNAPTFKISGLDIGSVQDMAAADAIPHLPGESTNGFPTSGQVDIAGNVYKYTAKVAMAADAIRGPYQFRQNAEYTDGGVARYGLECRDMHWGAATTAFDDYIVALDNGYNFIVNGCRSVETHTTGGVTYYDHHRLRYYSDNQTIAQVYASLATKVYLTGGLVLDTTQPLVSGKYQRHSSGTLCGVHIEGDIFCHWFSGSSGDPDATVEDLIEKIVKSSGGTITFPSDKTVASQSVSGDYTVGTVAYTEGFDLRFTTTSETVSIKADVKIEDLENSDTSIYIILADAGGGNVLLSLVSQPSSTTIAQYTLSGSTASHKYRVLAHDNFITVYKDDKWAMTYAFELLTYSTANAVKLSGTFTATDIRLQECPDWREAVYIDLETDGKSALSNVIQERPLERYCRSDGSYAIWYTPPTLGALTLTYDPIVHTWGTSFPREGASDAIVYNADKAQTIQHHNYAQEYGFSTKVFRMPNLKVGAIRAAKVLLDRLYAASTGHDVQMRLDARVEPGDQITFSYSASGTGRSEGASFIVENLSLGLTSQKGNLSLSGRSV